MICTECISAHPPHLKILVTPITGPKFSLGVERSLCSDCPESDSQMCFGCGHRGKYFSFIGTREKIVREQAFRLIFLGWSASKTGCNPFFLIAIAFLFYWLTIRELNTDNFIRKNVVNTTALGHRIPRFWWPQLLDPYFSRWPQSGQFEHRHLSIPRAVCKRGEFGQKYN